MMEGIGKIKNKILARKRVSKLKFQWILKVIWHLNFDICYYGEDYHPNRFLNSWASMGTTVKRSPTTPKLAILKMGASGSLLMATMMSDVFIPAWC